MSGNTDDWTGNLSGKKLAAASLLVSIVSLLTFTLMLVGALSGIVLGLTALVGVKNNPARGMSKVMAVAGILLSLLAFLPPYFYAAGNANAACAQRRTQEISSAENKYYITAGRYGTLNDLADAGLIGRDLVSPIQCGYRVELNIRKDNYEVLAAPQIRFLTGRKIIRFSSIQ